MGSVRQTVILTSRTNQDFTISVDVKPMIYNDSYDSYFTVGYEPKIYIGPNLVGMSGRAINFDSQDAPLGDYKTISFKISELWGGKLPQFDALTIWVNSYGRCLAYCDNFSLVAIKEARKRTGRGDNLEPWVRDVDMTCYQVWVNEDNNFEFVFWWEYANNNWVKIYDMAGNEVFSIDMQKGDAQFEADLPDGMYTVKTFHDDIATPLQEFVIGKP